MVVKFIYHLGCQWEAAGRVSFRRTLKPNSAAWDLYSVYPSARVPLVYCIGLALSAWSAR